MTILREHVDDAVGHGRLHDIEAAFEALVVGEEVNGADDRPLTTDERRKLLMTTAAVLANDERPVSPPLTAALREHVDGTVASGQSFARAAIMVAENIDRLMPAAGN